VLGFPECKRFVLTASGREGLYWLQSADHSALTFVVADPFRFFPDYAVDLAPNLVTELRANDPTDLAIFTIVTLPGNSDEATANLQGPLVVHLGERRALQHVIPDSPFGVRHVLDLSRINSGS
jgi:flagellar assembly factor FliW